MRSIPLLALLALSGCPSAPPDRGSAPSVPTSPTSAPDGLVCGDGGDGTAVVARLGSIAVSEGDLAAAIARLPPRARERYAAPEARRILARRVAEERAGCLAAAALSDTGAVRAVAARAAEEAAAAWMIDQAEAAAVREEAIVAWYEDHPETYRLDQRQLSHLVVADRERAEELAREVRAGADFADLARMHSLDRGSRDRGGDLGWVARGRLDPTWTEAAWALPVGQLSAPVQTEFGWHLILVRDTKDQQPLDEVRAGIERVLRGEAAEQVQERVRAGRELRFEGPLSE